MAMREGWHVIKPVLTVAEPCRVIPFPRLWGARPAQTRTKSITFRVTRSELDRLEAEAARRNVSVSDLVRTLIGRGLP